MFVYIVKRFLLALLAIFIIVFVTYLLLAAFGQNPFFQTTTNAQQAAALAKANGFDQPILERFGRWFGGLFKGDFGTAYTSAFFGRTIPQIYFGPLAYTFLISLPAFFLSIIIGIALGVLSGYKRGTWIDTLINFFVRFFISLPAFVIAPFFIILGSYANLPTRFVIPFSHDLIPNMIRSMILPVLVLTLSGLAVYTNYTRNQVITVLTSNHILIAKSKGLSTQAIFFKHVLKNISIPLSQLIIPSFLGLLTGSLIIQSYFGVPGTQVLIVSAFPNGQINIVMFNTLFFGGLSILLVIVTDVILVIFDPRIKIASKNPYGFTTIVKKYIKRKKENHNNLIFEKNKIKKQTFSQEDK